MRLNTVLWIVQGLLALVFAFAGGSKLVLPLEAMAGPIELPGPLLRFIGVADILGAIGLILPGLLRIRPGLTPLAAAGLSIITAGGAVITAMGGQVAVALIPLIVCLAAAAVAYSRWQSAPLVPISGPSGRSDAIRPSRSRASVSTIHR
jgi:hypothetical protein